jgi:4-hydroxyacetophenone monooxygenase
MISDGSEMMGASKDTAQGNFAEPAGRGDILAEAIAMANIPSLLMVTYQLTGDEKWLQEPYRPLRGRGIDDNDDGRLDPAIQEHIRIGALAAIRHWQATGEIALPRPSDDKLVEMLSVAMGEEIPLPYGEVIADGLGLLPQDAAHIPQALNVPQGFKVLIIGAGLSGVCAGIMLQREGVDFEILELNENFGGTWFGNRYPGSGVDTPNHLYSFSFAEYDWTHYFSLRGELYNYVEYVANKFGMADNTRFGTKVESARFDEARGIWVVESIGPNGPEVREANMVISAVGALDIPKIPAIAGAETFPGQSFHTARWPDDAEVAGKRVAVIGNGASAMQVVPAIADDVASMTIFARSKQWATPFPKFRVKVPDPIRHLIREVPLYQKWYRQRLAWTFNYRIYPTIQKDPEWPHPERSVSAANDRQRVALTNYIIEQLGDRQDLLPKVLPDYPPFGRRMLMDNGWFRTITRDHVELVTEQLTEIKGNTLVSSSGRTFDVDVLIWATGFHVAEFLASIDVRGRDGVSIREVWDGDDSKAYLGTTVPQFPNFFMLLGPNIGLGHGGSIIGSVEAQMEHVLQLMRKLFTSGAQTIEVRQDVYQTYNQAMDEAHDKMVFSHEGLDSWFRNARGRIVGITAWRHDDFWRMARDVKDDHYHFDSEAAE